MYIPKETREIFEEQKKDGCTCPLCGQYAKVYRRKLNSTMAVMLVKLYKHHKANSFAEFYHISEFLGSGNTGGDFSKLRYWNLVEPHENEDESKKTSGMWKLTWKGRMFAEGACGIPSHVDLYNGELLGFSGDPVYIYECFNKHFNYSELMGYRKESENDLHQCG